MLGPGAGGPSDQERWDNSGSCVSAGASVPGPPASGDTPPWSLPQVWGVLDTRAGLSRRTWETWGHVLGTGPFGLSRGQSGKQLLHRQMRVTQQLGSPSPRTAGRAGRAGGGDLSGPSTPGRQSARQAHRAEQGSAPSPLRALGPAALRLPPGAGGWGDGGEPGPGAGGGAFAEVVPTPKRVPFQLLGNSQVRPLLHGGPHAPTCPGLPGRATSPSRWPLRRDKPGGPL